MDLSFADLSGAGLNGTFLRGADLHGTNLTGASLIGADLSAELGNLSTGPVGADLTGANLNDADFTDAALSGAMAWGLVGCPAALPVSPASESGPYGCVGLPATGDFALIGPFVALSGADLSGADVTGVGTIELTSCPAALPSDAWRCVTHVEYHPGGSADVDFTLIGPGANVRQADLSSADLSGLDLSGADLSFALLTDADLTGVIWSNTICPDGTNSDASGGTCDGNISW